MKRQFFSTTCVTAAIAFAAVSAPWTVSGESALSAALGETPVLWLDASNEATLDYYLGDVASHGAEGYKYLRRWNDCRAEQTSLYALNPRGDGYVRVYPFVVTNGLGGMSVVSMGTAGTTVSGLDSQVNESTGAQGASNSGSEWRRLPLNKPVNAVEIIAVFGSANGGGAAIVGGYTQESTLKGFKGTELSEWDTSTTLPAFSRGGGGDAKSAFSAPILSSGDYPVRLDGEDVADATATGFSGDWQIVSVRAGSGSVAVRGIGVNGAAGSTAGGQQYAEILIYTNALSSAQREAVERYLSNKWGIEFDGIVGAPEGGSVSFAGGKVRMAGYGSVSATGDATMRGMLAGTLDIAAGVTVTVADEALPFTEAELPEENKIARFDPESTEDLVLDSSDHITVNGMYDCGKVHANGTQMLYAYYASGKDRRPLSTTGIRGDYGASRTWIDYNTPEGATGEKANGKDMRTTTIQTAISNHNGDNQAIAPTTLFIVSDSSSGGGSLAIGSPALNESVALSARASYGAEYTEPIWNSTWNAVKNSSTRLNGESAGNGLSNGLSGAPEVVSAVFGDSVAVKAFGYFGGSSYNKSHAILGEMIFYSSALDDETRGGIEAYLMKKWLGRLPEGYTDFRSATVTGSGKIVLPSFCAMPQFDAGFAGTAAVTATSLAFTFDATEGGIVDPVNVGAALEMPASGSIAVAGDLKNGTFPIVTAKSISGFSPSQWSVDSGKKAKLVLLSGEGTQSVALRVATATTIIFK